MNERSQPLVTRNADVRGELEMFDIIHAHLWNTERSLAYHLNQQGFLYVEHPIDMTEKEYEAVTKELSENKFEVQNLKDRIIVKTFSGLILDTVPLTKLKIDIDANFERTYQKNNALVVNGSPHGWIVHKIQKKIVMLEHADDITTIIREAEGGFYKLTEKQQPFLRPRVIDFKTPESFFTQNIAFNALQIIFRQLEIDFAFDSSGLFSDATTAATYTRMQELTSHSDVVDDFLTGALITEMLQHLMVTQSNSPRPALPLRFINTFSATQNNARAIANAFDLKRKDGLPALKVNKNEPVLTEDIDLLDTHIHGSLANPLLTNSKNTAALLTTSILVAEQMLLEQLLRDACKHGLSHPNAKALKAILANSQPATNESEYNELVALASKLPSNEFGPILGLQFPYCEPIVVKLRKIIGIHYQKSFMENVLGGRRTLIDVVNTLYQMDNQIAGAKIADIGNNYRVIKGFKNLFYIGQVLQDLNGISVRHEQSRGVNAGLIAVIQKLAPVLYAELVNSGKFEAAVRIDPIQTLIEKSTPHPILEDDSMSTCPYIRAINAKKMAEETSSLKPSVTSSLPSNNSWSSFFRKHATGIILTTGAASASMIYFANRPA